MGTEVERRPASLPVPVPGMPQRKRESEALIPRAFRAARRNRHVSVPLAFPAATWVTALPLHAFGAAPETAAAGAAVAGAVWLFAPHKWTGKDGEPRTPEVWYARATAAAFPAWLAAAAYLGPVSASGPGLAGALAVLGAAWGVPWYRHYRVRGLKARKRELQQWQAWWGGHSLAWGAGGSRVTEAEVSLSQVRLRVQLIRGRQSLLTLKGSVHLIESAAAVDSGMVRVAAVKGDASQADVFVKQENPLRDIVEWDPALAPSSVHEDAVIGISETGEVVRAPQRVSAFINGRTRSGKGNHLLLRLVNLSACPDDRQVVIDLKQRAARTLLRGGALEYVITDIAEARAYLMMLRAERAARARGADTGEEQLLASESTPAIHTLIDEANPLTSEMAGDAACTRLVALLAAEGAGLEQYVEAYSQYGALAESVGTEQTRSNCPLRVCYAVERPEHGEFALGPGGGDASRLEGQGEFLMKLGPRARPERLRAQHMPFRLFTEVTAANAARLKRRRLHLWCGAEPSVLPGLTWQEWWDRRFLRIDPAFRKDSPQYAAAVEQYGDPEGAAPAGASPSPAAAAAPPPAADAGLPSGAEVAARIAAETSGPDLAPAADAQARAAEIYARSEARFFELLAAAPPEGIRMADLIGQSGISSSQAYDIRKGLALRGAIAQPGRGAVAPVPGRDPAAEWAAARAGDGRLREEAERRLHSVA